jgi:hypothetical protein
MNEICANVFEAPLESITEFSIILWTLFLALFSRCNDDYGCNYNTVDYSCSERVKLDYIEI